MTSAKLRRALRRRERLKRRGRSKPDQGKSVEARVLEWCAEHPDKVVTIARSILSPNVVRAADSILDSARKDDDDSD